MLVGCSIDWKFNADFKNGIKRDQISSRSWVMTLFVDSNHVKFSKVMFPASGLKKRAKIKKPKSNSLFKVLPCQGKWLILTFFPYVRVPCKQGEARNLERMGKTCFELSKGRRQLMAFYFRLRYVCCVPQVKKSDSDPPLKNKGKFKCS